MSKTYAGLTTQSDADQINMFLLGQQATISPALSKKLERLQVAADLLRKHGSRMKVAGILQTLWPADCSRATAYRYIEEAQDVFAPQQTASREFYVDVVMGMLFSTHAKALAKQDLKTAAATEKNIMVAIAKFFGTSEAFPLDKVQVPHYTMTFDPALVGAKPLPTDWRAQLDRILATRQVGVVAQQADAKSAAAPLAQEEPETDASALHE